ncbi:sulfatase-like hydrolase/transferase [uncultured Rubinisphaera sp.]|uniref:sulfatase-like hydrolase/transferase n=1 Tax=uncultured Rubinisphaera sp. TaxID=1678686 RepID=UPI0030DD00BD
MRVCNRFFLAGRILAMLCLLLFTICPDSIFAAGPNILLITVDNLGYGDLKMYNSQSELITPHLDQLAASGAQLTSFYTASPTCTVSRACLLTGRVPQRHGLSQQLAGVAGNYGVGLSRSEMIIPAYLNASNTGYQTGCFGKWNIGFAPGSRPTERGFHEFLGHASGNCDYYRHNYRDKHDLYQGIEPLHRQGEYTSNIFADAAIDFISRHSEHQTPWFCYLPFNAPHFPTAGNKRDGEPNIYQAPDHAFTQIGLTPAETDPRKRYAAVVFAVDYAIGRVLEQLRQSNVQEETFVFFMSDNGAFRLNRQGLDVGINTPLRAGGVTCWEGGLRVPALASWPGKIPPGSVIDEPLWSPDLLAAIATLTNCELPEQVTFDGNNPLPVLCGQAESPHQSLCFQYQKQTALRMGQWKIIRQAPDQPWQLFDLTTDLAESKDRASVHPEIVERLDAELRRWERSFK